MRRPPAHRDALAASEASAELGLGACSAREARCIRWCLDRSVIDLAAPLSLVSARVWAGGEPDGEGGEALVVGGYYQVFDHVLRTAQQNANVVGPLYGHAVTEIDWTAVAAALPEPASDASPLDSLGAALSASLPPSSATAAAQVVVRCANGVEFRADRVLLTVPHAVLKHEPPTLVFTPPLPPPMRAAIEHVHAGLMNLVVLWYPHFFWPLEYHFFGVARDERREPLAFSTFLSPKILDQRGERVPMLMCVADFRLVCLVWLGLS